ncbi:MAG: PKD domain-containing protein, partial [Candidatus Thermoplasmatota archaeon]
EVVSTESTSYSSDPSLFVDSSGTVHVAWEDETDYGGSGSDPDIFYKRKPSGGSWTVTELVSTESTSYSWYPSLFVDSSGTVHVAWDDATDYGGSGSDRDIFYKTKVSNILTNEINIFSSRSMNLLNDIFSESQWTAQDGDYFQAKMQSDEIELVVDAIVDGISFGSGLSPTVQQIVNIRKLSLPGGIGFAYAHCLHIKEVLDPYFIRYLFINGYHPVLEVLQWALLYAAADITEQGIDDLTLWSAKELLKAPLKPQNALQTHFLPMLETNEMNLLSVIQTTQAEVLANMPTLTPEQVDLYKEDLSARRQANMKLASIFSRQALSLHQAQDSHESSGWSDKLLSFLFKFALRYLVWLILGPYGLILLAAIELGKNLYENTQKLTENARMMELASAALTNSFDTSKRIHLNTVAGLKNIQYSIPPQIAQGEIVSIQNHLIGPTWLWKHEIKTFTKEAYSDITVQNTGSGPSLQYLFADYDVYNFWGTKNVPVVINSPLQTVNPGSETTFRVYYVYDSVGLCPSKGTTIDFSLLGETDTGIYYLDTGSTSFQVSMRGTLNETDLLPYPISNSLQLLPNSTTRLFQIHIENPFNESISVNVTQGVPPDITLIDTDNGSISNNTILWHCTIPPLAFHCFNVTFIPEEFGNVSYVLPATNLSIYDPVNDYHLYFETNFTIFTAGVPLRFHVIPPTEVPSGISIVIPCVITNLLNETYAGNLSVVIRDTNTTVFNHTQGVSLNALQVQEINITMNCSLQPGVYVMEGSWHSNNFTLPLFQETLSVDAAYVLGSALLQGGTNHSGILVTLGSFTTQTGVEGYFTFLGIPMGNYTLSLTHPGYENASINVTLGKGFNVIPQLVLQKVNHPPFVPNNPSPANASQGVNLTETLSWIGGDPDEEDVVTYDMFFGTTTTPLQVSFNQSEASYSTGNLTYSTTYYWRVRAWDDRGASMLGPLWEFTTMVPPNAPPVFSIPSPDNNSVGHPLTMTWGIQISDPEGDLFNWTIQCSNGQATSGTNDNNGTKSLGLSGLAYSTLYTICVNATDPTGSDHYTRAWYTFTTKASLPPEFGTPSPANGSTNQPLILTWSISINDPEGDLFDWTIQCSNGQSNGGTGASNGTKTLSLSGLAYSTTYKVWVNATDPTGSGQYSRRWYIFTTKASLPPVFGSPSPVNGSANQPLSFTWTIHISDPEGDSFDWTIECSNGQTNSGTGATNGTKSLTLSGLAYSTTYTVWVNATDPSGSGIYTRRWYVFTTKASLPPVFGTPTPANSSTGNPLSLTWSIPINDPEGDLFDWTIQCSNGQTNSGTGATNGTKSLSLSGLVYSTMYTVWVNATDPAGSGLYTRAWYTFTTQEEPNNPPNKPDRPSGETNGKINTKYTYTTSTIDPNGDQVYYLWDWGDGLQSTWLGPYDSGAEATAEHTWTTKDTYSIKVKAKDTQDAESDWSDPLAITMPFSYDHPILHFWKAFFERFPNAFPILRHLMGY